MQITSVRFSSELSTVYATIEGARFEFTSFRAGPVEVYDYPKSFGGLTRQVGYLTAEQARKLAIVIARASDGIEAYEGAARVYLSGPRLYQFLRGFAGNDEQAAHAPFGR